MTRGAAIAIMLAIGVGAVAFAAQAPRRRAVARRYRVGPSYPVRVDAGDRDWSSLGRLAVSIAGSVV